MSGGRISSSCAINPASMCDEGAIGWYNKVSDKDKYWV